MLPSPMEALRVDLPVVAADPPARPTWTITFAESGAHGSGNGCDCNERGPFGRCARGSDAVGAIRKGHRGVTPLAPLGKGHRGDAAKRPAQQPDPVDRYLVEVYHVAHQVGFDGDFTWKDPAAAKRLSMSLKTYVINGMDADFREQLYHAGPA